MNKILFLCVNYNSYNELFNYLKSIDTAAMKFIKKWVIEVMVADNTENNYKQIDYSNYFNIKVKVFDFHKNFGYLGGVTKIIEDNADLNLERYKYVIISNVDIIVPSNFLDKLINYDLNDDTAWLAPKIYSHKEKRDRNPKILQKPSIKAINKSLLLFLHPLVYNIYARTLYKLKKLPYQKEIYAGHGSFMIFSGSFFLQIKDFKFPSFLFGEEIFLGDLVQKARMKVIYEPSIEVMDIDHASTEKLKGKNYCKMNRDSLTIIKKYLYE